MPFAMLDKFTTQTCNSLALRFLEKGPFHRHVGALPSEQMGMNEGIQEPTYTTGTTYHRSKHDSQLRASASILVNTQLIIQSCTTNKYFRCNYTKRFRGMIAAEYKLRLITYEHSLPSPSHFF